MSHLWDRSYKSGDLGRPPNGNALTPSTIIISKDAFISKPAGGEAAGLGE